MKRLFSLTLVLASASLYGQLLLKPVDAIKAAYPASTSSKKNSILLTKAQASTVQKLIKKKLKSKIFTFYIIKQDKKVIAFAGLYTNKVRSKTGTYITFITPEGKINAIEVVAFNEPPEYIPKKRWLKLFNDKTISDNIKVKESIPNLSGATLSATSASDTAKLMLAVWEVKYKK
jgi:hypothetical protein